MVVVVGGEVAKRSHDAVVLMRPPPPPPLGTQHRLHRAWSRHAGMEARAAAAPLLTDKLTLTVSWRNQRSLKVSICL